MRVTPPPPRASADSVEALAPPARAGLFRLAAFRSAAAGVFFDAAGGLLEDLLR